jgi:hypothetical protein
VTKNPPSDWYRALPTGHFGYPQPEDSWYTATYGSDYCIRCGIAPSQTHPFRLRGEPKARHSDFIWINWVHDALFVRPHVAADLAAAGIIGVEVFPVLRHKTGTPLETIVQLQILESLPSGAVLTDELQIVTCKPDNEESHVRIEGGASRIPPGAPYCGRKKYHAPLKSRIRESGFNESPDIVRSAEWFGSGGQAFREIFVSSRVVDLATSRKWRGSLWKTPGVIR